MDQKADERMKMKYSHKSMFFNVFGGCHAGEFLKSDRKGIPVPETAACGKIADIDLSVARLDQLLTMPDAKLVEVIAKVHAFPYVDHGRELVCRYPHFLGQLTNGISGLQIRFPGSHKHVQAVDYIVRVVEIMSAATGFVLFFVPEKRPQPMGPL